MSHITSNIQFCIHLHGFTQLLTPRR